MSMKHTPGPWAVYAERELIAGAGGDFCPFGGCGCCGSPWMSADDESTQVADARLIAAAPDLLDVAKMCLEAEEERRKKLKPGAPATTYTEQRIAKLRSVIAKATGVAQ